MARRYMEPKYREETVDEDGFHEALSAAPVRPYAYRDEYVVAVSPAERIASFVVAAAWIIEGILALRIILQLFAASDSSPFAGFIYAISYPFAWPFMGIAGSSYVGTGGLLEWASVIALAVYGIIAYVVVWALRSVRDVV